jgi:hypothetical protein
MVLKNVIVLTPGGEWYYHDLNVATVKRWRKNKSSTILFIASHSVLPPKVFDRQEFSRKSLIKNFSYFYFFLIHNFHFWVTNAISDGLYYKHVMIINDNSSVVSKRSFKLIDDPSVVIYNHHRFIIEATGGRNFGKTLWYHVWYDTGIGKVSDGIRVAIWGIGVVLPSSYLLLA